MFVWSILLTLLLAGTSHGKAVFAHFMVGNTGNYTEKDFQDDIAKAKEAHIDAFALNMANADPLNDAVVSIFFMEAEKLGFQLFFSFDYAGNGPWPMGDVINLINNYGGKASYYHYEGKPLVSTFEGPENSDDWFIIKQSTGCFFVPDWSSLGAKPAVELGTADGLFNWAAWPWGGQEMNTYVDASYTEYLDGLPYMMPASPWFYTNLPGYKKNWLWRGDNLWYDRWQEIWYLKPPFVQIISWNDYGESHYIGPLRDYAMDAFHIGRAPYNYVTDMPHDGWRLFLPFLIDTYKYGKATIDKEGLTVWHRPQPASACSSGGTSGNTASQLQIEFHPIEIVQDHIFFSALLSAPATITVSIGGVSQQASWTWQPDGGVGIYHGSVPFGSSLGDVVVTLSRSGKQIAQVRGSSISTNCIKGLTNWNAWVGSASASESVNAKPEANLFNQKCINGTGANNFAGLCEFGCKYGYCPLGACYCQLQGEPRETPNATGPMGYPRAGLDASYSGLCAFDCPHGFCPDTACSTVSAPLSTPTVSPFLPPACIGGTGEGNLAGLCDFACNLGFCPINACTCTAQGALHTLPEATDKVGEAGPGMDETVYGPLCAFTCKYGYCPEGACAVSTSGGGDGKGSGEVYVDPDIFLEPSPVVGCIPPCTLIMPDLLLNAPTTIYLSPVATSIVLGPTTIKTVYPSPITTTAVNYFNMPVGASQTRPFSFYLTPSHSPDPVTLEAGGTSTTLILPPVSVQSIPAGATITWVETSLGTTEYYTNGETYTYSEAQFPSLSDLATSTVTTTTLPARTSAATSATSTTVVPVWVQAGGFYWSPVPKPTPKPGDMPVPPLPSFPPIPTAPCFKLFNLFSIDCPPNRFIPTTTFSSHAPFPTCTDTNSPGCGHPCTSNCGSSSSDECTTHTATNYWVTCSGTSCSTTKTATFTGCSVTNSATTTGKYCPTGVTIDPNDDQGANGYPPRTTSTITTSIPEIAVVGGEPYTVTGGTINVDGTTIRVPNVGGREQVSTTIGNVPMVIIPSYSGTIAVPLFPTAIPTVSATTTTTNNEPSTSSETTTTTKTSTTSSLPSATAASGCSSTGNGSWRVVRRCWNKCDPGTGSPVGGDWAENDPWCWIAKSGSDSYSNCLKQSDCPTDFECAKSWGCVVPLSGGCAPQGGNTGLEAKICWSSCNEKTGKRTNDKWEEGMPWCWLQDYSFASCDKDDDCSATTECAPDHWYRGGCGKT
ncbi:glycoside hydrolase family 71 protein [Aspergillus alliaceus]|uniref:glycoside hydrolase family 71 protein n=1 Tax=Petromyces alliaceus TaxID=209559 RepID=UPI0012A49E9C|nr:glycosyl hydrolase family 71-domain-containing protein [Aspergillus alliaceus]KAB8232369.1 glycosyl hydrolase family 71-domain-containing protein [Aspergillus alliaceus]